ncbi:MAG: hypothetical protein ACKV19_22905 [Verrucomicrobiales bacterium]
MNSDGWRRDGSIPLKNASGHFILLGLFGLAAGHQLTAASPQEMFLSQNPASIATLSTEELRGVSDGIPAELDPAAKELVVCLFERWAESDPVGGLACLVGLPTDSGQVAAEAFFTVAARLHPESIDHWAANLPDQIPDEPQDEASVRARQRMLELVKELGIVCLDSYADSPMDLATEAQANPVKSVALDICVAAKVAA